MVPSMIQSAEPYTRRWMRECLSNGHLLFLDKTYRVVVRCSDCQREEWFDFIDE